MFNSKKIFKKKLESNHKIALSDSSITKKLKDMEYLFHLQFRDSNFQKFRWKPERNGRRSLVLLIKTMQFK